MHAFVYYYMKILLSLASFLCALSVPSSAALLWMDNFTSANTNNFDGAFGPDGVTMAGRLSGSESGNTTFRSWGFQQSINNNQLLLPQGGNGVRFGGQTTRFDWAGGTSGPAILAAGGFVVGFDWIPQDDTNNEWVSF